MDGRHLQARAPEVLIGWGVSGVTCRTLGLECSCDRATGCIYVASARSWVLGPGQTCPTPKEPTPWNRESSGPDPYLSFLWGKLRLRRSRNLQKALLSMADPRFTPVPTTGSSPLGSPLGVLSPSPSPPHPQSRTSPCVWRRQQCVRERSRASSAHSSSPRWGACNLVIASLPVVYKTLSQTPPARPSLCRWPPISLLETQRLSEDKDLTQAHSERQSRLECRGKALCWADYALALDEECLGGISGTVAGRVAGVRGHLSLKSTWELPTLHSSALRLGE